MNKTRRIIGKYSTLFLNRLKGAFPIILFYIIQFLLVNVLFGQRYILVVTCSTAVFQIRRKQYNNIWDYIQIFVISLLLCLLACLATCNIALCVLLNLIVPICLVFWKSSQFTPKGYLGFAMTFVFLELRPLAPSEFPTIFAAILLCSVLLVLALILHSRLYYHVLKPTTQITNSLLQLSEILDRFSQEQDTSVAACKKLYDIAQTLHHLGHS